MGMEGLPWGGWRCRRAWILIAGCYSVQYDLEGVAIGDTNSGTAAASLLRGRRGGGRLFAGRREAAYLAAAFVDPDQEPGG